MADAPQHHLSPGALLDGLLSSPLVGLSPWIVYSIVEGQGRLEESSAIALGTALVILMVGWLRGSSPKLLEFSDVIFFGGLAIFVAVASDSTHHWLERWSGEVANIALVAIAVGSIVIRQPFTLAYAKETVPKALWTNPRFLRTNYILTWVWAIAFIIEAASGFYGDQVLHDSNNIWTGWIIQTLPLIFAAQFTIWYPKRARALGTAASGQAAEPAPPVGEFIAQVSPWISITGVVVLAIAGSTPWWIGVGLIVIGASLTKRFGPEHGDRPTPA